MAALRLAGRSSVSRVSRLLRCRQVLRPRSGIACAMRTEAHAWPGPYQPGCRSALTSWPVRLMKRYYSGLRQLTRQQPGTADHRRTSGHCRANRESIATRGEMVMRLTLVSLLLPTFLGKPALFFGDSSGYLYGLDGATGKQLWKLSLDEHPAAKATSTPVFYQGRLYVGVSSLEEALSVSPAYVCCTFRGSVSAIQALDGKVVWKRYTIDEPAKERPKTK